METKYWNLQSEIIDINNSAIQEAAAAIRNGETIAFPTETVYGLGADATSEEAVDKIFQAKGRPADNPLIVHVGEMDQVHSLVTEIPEMAGKLMEKFWPGPLTVILNSNGSCAEKVTAGLHTVGIRLPDHPIARALIKVSGRPVAAPSANRSGRPSPTTAQHVSEDLSERIFGILDGGPTGVGVESTVIDCTGETPIILRPGGVTQEEIEGVVGPISVDAALKDESAKPKSPGMKYIHYAPDVPLWLIHGNVMNMHNELNRLEAEGKKVGIITTDEHIDQFQGVVVKSLGSKENLKEVAQNIYDVLRAFNKEDVDVILGITFPKKGVGVAIMNRLEKAASKIIKL